MKDEEHDETDEGTAPSLPEGDGFDFQMIDSLYRRWTTGTRGEGPVTEADPVVLDVYGLLKSYGEKMFALFRNNGAALTGRRGETGDNQRDRAGVFKSRQNHAFRDSVFGLPSRGDEAIRRKAP